jgi:hypothetical protein
VSNFGPIVGVDVPNENPPSWHNNGFRQRHSSGTVALDLCVRLSHKVSLAIREDMSNCIGAEGLGRPYN